MAKSFCESCKNWVRTQDMLSERFWYCKKFEECELKYRRLFCNGKYKESKRQKS